MKDKLKNLIEQKGYTLTAIAKKAGMNRVYLSHILSGYRKITDKTLKKILVGAFNYRSSDAEEQIEKWKLETAAKNLSEMSDIDAPPVYKYIASMSELKGKKNLIEQFGTIDLTKQFASVPRLGHVVCGAFRQSDIIGKDYFEQILLKKDKTYFSLVADGISMIGKIDPGDIVLVEQATENIPGKIMLFGIREEYALGYLYQDESGFIEIRKANKDFPPIKVNDPDFKIVGVVRAITKVNP